MLALGNSGDQRVLEALLSRLAVLSVLGWAMSQRFGIRRQTEQEETELQPQPVSIEMGELAATGQRLIVGALTILPRVSRDFEAD
jgi:predicted Zn-dependent protease